jgi:transcriptional regulator MraZ
MFLGKHERNLDEKGRLAIPAKFRDGLPSGSVITIAPDGCLRIYPRPEWEAVMDQNKLSAATAPSERHLIRQLFAGASDLELDRQGRTLIPANLRQQAGIGEAAVVIGANNVVEIWATEKWQAIEAGEDFTKLADEVAKSRVQP